MTAQGMVTKVTLKWLLEWHSVDKCLPGCGVEVCAFQQVERQDVVGLDGRKVNEVGTAYYWLVNNGGRIKMERRFRSSWYGGGR
jgi:hypothetical protein